MRISQTLNQQSRTMELLWISALALALLMSSEGEAAATAAKTNNAQIESAIETPAQKQLADFAASELEAATEILEITLLNSAVFENEQSWARVEPAVQKALDQRIEAEKALRSYRQASATERPFAQEDLESSIFDLQDTLLQVESHLFAAIARSGARGTARNRTLD